MAVLGRESENENKGLTVVASVTRRAARRRSFAHGHGTGEALPIPIEAQTDSPLYSNRRILFVKARVSVSDSTRDPSHCPVIVLELPRLPSVVVSPQRGLPVGCAGR
jgi:hypothetical protein